MRAERAQGPVPHRLVAVEGLHGVGKSLVSAALSERLGAALIHFTPEFGRFRRDARLDTHVAPLPRLLYYLATLMHASDLARDELRSRHVVCDRWIASPISLLLGDGSLAREQIAAALGPYEDGCVRPDFTILLTADHGAARERLRRRQDREPTWSQREICASAAFFERWQAEMHREVARRGPFVAIDTTRLEPREVVAAAEAATLAHLERYGTGAG